MFKVDLEYVRMALHHDVCAVTSSEPKINRQYKIWGCIKV